MRAKATLREKEIDEEFESLITQAGRIIHLLLEEESSEKFAVVSRVCESIQWASKARWSYAEFAKEGRLGKLNGGSE